MSDGQPHLVPPPERRCRFVKTNGARCTMPALHKQDLCFDHTYRVRVIRGHAKRIKREEPYMVPLIDYHWVEEHHAIVRNLNEISQQLANGAINHRQANTFILLQRTLLKTLRQMRDIQELERPVEEYVEQDGVPLSVPDNDAAGQPIDRTADPERPTLNFDPSTTEGARNQEQKLLWEYFSADPASGVRSGLDINWPGRPADFVPPDPSASPAGSPPSGSEVPSDSEAATPPASASPEKNDEPDLPQPSPEQDRVSDQADSLHPWTHSQPSVPAVLVSQPTPDPAAALCLTLQAVADPGCVTPSESASIPPQTSVTSFDSILTQNLARNSRRSHTYAKFEDFFPAVRSDVPRTTLRIRT